MKFIVALSTLLFGGLLFGSISTSIASARGFNQALNENLLAPVNQSGAYWDQWQSNHCTGRGLRQHSARIMGSTNWEADCANTPAERDGHPFPGATRCVKIAPLGIGLEMWGQFDVPDSSCISYWDTFKPDRCTSLGLRQYSAILRVPPDRRWETECAATGATILGQQFDKPARCKNEGPGGMWGEFDVKDDSCIPKWEPFKADQCVAFGVRQYSAQLLVPNGLAWETCSGIGATIQGQQFARPDRCKNEGIGGMWGEFDVKDDSCLPAWNPFKEDYCVDLGKRQLSSQIIVPNGLSWEVACNTTGAAIQGQVIPKPDRCKNMGVAGMWGEFDVVDNSCRPRWGEFGRDHCTGIRTRQYSAILWDIPNLLSWERVCTLTGAKVAGQVFSKPSRCVRLEVAGIGINMWGEFDVTDYTCVVEYPLRQVSWQQLVGVAIILVLAVGLFLLRARFFPGKKTDPKREVEG